MTHQLSPEQNKQIENFIEFSKVVSAKVVKGGTPLNQNFPEWTVEIFGVRDTPLGRFSFYGEGHYLVEQPPYDCAPGEFIIQRKNQDDE